MQEDSAGEYAGCCTEERWRNQLDSCDTRDPLLIVSELTILLSVMAGLPKAAGCWDAPPSSYDLGFRA